MIDKLIQFSLKNRLLVLVLSLVVALSGYLSYMQLPVDAFPDVSPNLVQVFTITEGLAPEEIEKYITYPVEAAMNGLPGIAKIRSVSNFGLSVVNVYFEDQVDLYFARRLVDERLQEAREHTPTMNLHHPDPVCDLDYVPNTSRDVSAAGGVRTTLSNSFGFGGQNNTLVITRYDM